MQIPITSIYKDVSMWSLLTHFNRRRRRNQESDSLIRGRTRKFLYLMPYIIIILAYKINYLTNK